jgi:hypothetical protein
MDQYLFTNLDFQPDNQLKVNLNPNHKFLDLILRSIAS